MLADSMAYSFRAQIEFGRSEMIQRYTRYIYTNVTFIKQKYRAVQDCLDGKVDIYIDML